MMNDPKHWLDDGGGATYDERELLRAACERKMPAALRSSVWGGVAAGITALETVTVAGAAVKQGAAAKGALALLTGSAAKGVAAIAIAGGVGFGAMSLASGPRAGAHGDIAPHAKSLVPPSPLPPSVGPVERDVPIDVGAKPIVEGTKQRAPRTALPSARSAAPVTARRAENEAPTAEAQESRRATRLAAETSAVVAIRKTLLSGRPADALRQLEQARGEFADGVLAQEREALTVRALWQADQKDAARVRGEAFLRAFPRSPHAAELRALLGQ